MEGAFYILPREEVWCTLFHFESQLPKLVKTNKNAPLNMVIYTKISTATKKLLKKFI